MAKGAYIGVQRALPDEYTKLTYIKSSGNQYINTGFAPNQDSRMVIDAKVTSNAGTISLGGQRYNSAKQAFVWISTSSTNLRSYYNVGYVKVGNADLNRHIYDKNKNITYIDGEKVGEQSYASFKGDFSIYLFACNEEGSPDFFIQAEIYSAQIYDNGSLIHDFVPCKNSSDEVGMYDLITSNFFGNSGTGAFVAGSVDNTQMSPRALKIKKGYFGVANLAHKIKKAYIGIGGVARPCWGGGELTYYGRATNLSASRAQLAAASIGDYALFGGGSQGRDTILATIDAYNKSLTRTTPTPLTRARDKLAATSISEYALFAGGDLDGYVNGTSSVDAYSASLTKSMPTRLSESKYELAAARAGDYALFAGGYDSGTSPKSGVDAYNTSLTKTALTPLRVAGNGYAATSISETAIFAGNFSSSADAYDASLTRISLTAISPNRQYLAATAISDYALFGGGESLSPSEIGYDNVDAYDNSLTRMILTPLSIPRSKLAATSIGGYAIFGGGWQKYPNYKNVVDSYDESLTRITISSLSAPRMQLASTSIDNYALFAGGIGTSATARAEVDVYTIV